MPYSPPVQATVDQLAAMVRDAYHAYSVDLSDPETQRAIRATWWIIASNQPSLPWILAAISETLDYPPPPQ